MVSENSGDNKIEEEGSHDNSVNKTMNLFSFRRANTSFVA